MGETRNKAFLFLDDLKQSWYFRAWFGLWVVCFIAWIVALGVTSHRAGQGTSEKDWRLWVENVTSMNWPTFSFHTSWDDEPTLSFVPNSLKCTQESTSASSHNLLLQPKLCSQETQMDKCFSISTDVKAKPDKYGITYILCSFDTIGLLNGENTLIGFQIQESFGQPVWIAPTQDAWVLLSKAIFKPEGSAQIPFWSSKLVYHSSVDANQTSYKVAVIIDTFLVFHYDEYDFYTGLMNAADLGGFAYFLFLLMTVVMILVGIILDNDSSFLKRTSGDGRPFQTL